MPQTDTHDTAAQTPNTRCTKPSSHNGLKTILIVSDAPAFQARLDAMVREGGGQPICVGCAQSIDQIIKTEQHVLAILDCQTICDAGKERCHLLRPEPGSNDLPILHVASPRGSFQQCRQMMRPVDCLIPSADTERLRLLIQNPALMRQRPSMDESAAGPEEQLEAQLSRLRQVGLGQQRLLTRTGRFKGLSTAVRFQPVLEAGGDFYEIMQLSPEVFGVLVADVSGHDMDVAYMTGALKALSHSYVSEALSVQESMVLFNVALRRILPTGLYVTACYAKVNLISRCMEVAVAGHPCPLIQKTNQKVTQLDVIGDVLGPHENAICGIDTITLEPQDRVFFYTDGLIENRRGHEGAALSRSQATRCLSERLVAWREWPLQDAVDGIVDDMVLHAFGSRDDDIVLLAIEI